MWVILQWQSSISFFFPAFALLSSSATRHALSLSLHLAFVLNDMLVFYYYTGRRGKLVWGVLTYQHFIPIFLHSLSSRPQRPVMP